MDVRQALIQQSPSLALQRAAADEIARLDSENARLREQVERFSDRKPVITHCDEACD